MPPEENKLKIGLDPVFKGNQDNQKQAENTPTAFNVLSNQKYTPSQTPFLSSFPKPTNEAPNPKSIIRTYKGDLASAIKVSIKLRMILTACIIKQPAGMNHTLDLNLPG